MRLLKPSDEFPNEISKYWTIFKNSKWLIQVVELYKPHWLEFNVWHMGSDNGFTVLHTSKIVALNAKSRKFKKQLGNDASLIKTKIYNKQEVVC